MINWKFDKNVISEVIWNGKNIINPWGVETADSWAFFSMEEGVGYRYRVIDFRAIENGNVYSSVHHVKMHEGEWILEVQDELHENKIQRTAKLLCLKDSYFMDFVVRFRFKKEFFNHAQISNKIINHTASNIYHQYPVKEASLDGKDLNVNVRILSFECTNKFMPHLYVRDHRDEWVIHARMLPIKSDKSIIKLCSRYFKTSPLPQFISKKILSNQILKDKLWYRSEHRPYQSRIAKIFSPNAFPLVRLKKGQEIKWRVEVELSGK